ncbi:hypothetical protein QR680_007154 [Steinernema hermaphroditum]|uniref:Protein F37C4.5 n=1 Tax=Steinernema hermaphroditum TaxID=289476 RepID=A0AA39HZ23_9BILA|nr:hypothetical protein QR680_007154 [Steinernema hermaphroditum]
MTSPSISFKATDLPIQSVTVFNDRAQIKRELKTNLPAGTHEIIIENLANTIDGDSIRVDGTGAAQIHEVKFKNEHVVREDINSPDVQKLVNEKKDLETRKKHLDDKKSLLKRRIDTLNSMTGKLGCCDGTFVFDEGFEDQMDKFFGFYDNTAADIQRKTRETNKSLENLEKQIIVLNERIDNLRHGANVSRNICIVLDVSEESDLTFVITYQVYSARWSPVYEIRALTFDDPDKKTVLQVDYFAMIEQTTGEEWTDARILLSTAQPYLEGDLPELGTLKASLHRVPPPEARRKRWEAKYARLGNDADSDSDVSCLSVPKRKEMTASQQVLSTEFELPEKKTIPSDSSEHKMLITNVAFEPSLLHECVPKKSTNVFLTASVVNNSEFPLIEGDAAVYLNHNFVAKTHLKAVAPREKFTCSLGVDNTVKVAYKAPQKFNTESGMFSKQATVTYTQHITIQNNKASEPITILIKEHVPRATDDKLKVKLLEPFVELPKAGHTAKKEPLNTVGIPGIILNSDHNLEWTEKIEQGGKKELVVKWQIDYPTGQKVQYNEDF